MLNLLSYPRAPVLVRVLAIGLAATFVIALAIKVKQNARDAAIDESAIEEATSDTSYLPDFEAITNVDEKKEAFFSFLLDYVEAENNRILDDREKVLWLWAIARDDTPFSAPENATLQELANKYRLSESNLAPYALLDELVSRIDVIPVSLVLAQAANESAWGTSRFAKEGNNIFGQWCFDEGCGLIPGRRRPNASHEVRAFASIAASVRSYLLNLNTHAAYSSLREMRRDMREQGRPLDAIVLAHGLTAYSERGPLYVSELHEIIRQNSLELLDRS